MTLLTSSLRNVPVRLRSVQATFEYSWAGLLQGEQLSLAWLSAMPLITWHFWRGRKKP
jgi:hypothetical protein